MPLMPHAEDATRSGTGPFVVEAEARAAPRSAVVGGGDIGPPGGHPGAEGVGPRIFCIGAQNSSRREAACVNGLRGLPI